MTEIPARRACCAGYPGGRRQRGTEPLRFVVVAGPGGAAKGKGSAGVLQSSLASFILALFQFGIIFTFFFFQVTSVLKNS